MPVTKGEERRWATFGLIDGLVLGALCGVALVLYLASLDTEAVGLGVDGYASVFASSAVYGAGTGVLIGLLLGLPIDVLRARGVSDVVAVAAVMIPALSFALCFLFPTSLPAVVIVVLDVVWRFARLRRLAGTD